MEKTRQDYDIMIFYSDEEIEDKLKWLKRLKDIITNDVRALEMSSQAYRSDDYFKDRSSFSDSGEIPKIFYMSFAKEVDEIEDIGKVVDDTITSRIETLDALQRLIDTIEKLKGDIEFGGKPVIIIMDPVWYILGTSYLYSPDDIPQKYNGSYNFTPFIYYVY